MTNTVIARQAHPDTRESTVHLRTERPRGARPAVASATAGAPRSRLRWLVVRIARALGPGPVPLAATDRGRPRNAWEQDAGWEAGTRLANQWRV